MTEAGRADSGTGTGATEVALMIVGTPRSGTTLVQRVVAETSGLPTVPDELAPGPRLMVEKTPDHLLWVPYLAPVMERTRSVAVVRDPRAPGRREHGASASGLRRRRREQTGRRRCHRSSGCFPGVPAQELAWKHPVGAPVGQERARAWEKALSPQTEAIVERVCGPETAVLGCSSSSVRGGRHLSSDFDRLRYRIRGQAHELRVRHRCGPRAGLG